MKQKRIPLVGRQYLVPFILITSLFFLWGFAHAILNVLNKHFQEILDITKTHSAFIQMTMYMGYFIMAIPAGFFISRFGYRRGVVFGLLLYGVGSLLFIPGQHYLSFNLFLFALFVIGCGLTFLETAANPYATELGAKETAASRLNFAQSFNGLGCICAPVLAGLLLFSKDGQTGSGNVALPYICMGVIVLLVALVFSRIKLPEIEHSVEVAKLESRGIPKEHIDIIRKSGISLEQWLGGFKSAEEAVKESVESLKNHPLMPKDIVIRGFMMDSVTGELSALS